MTDESETPPAPREGAAAPPRVVLAGFLMGLANLVPGVSGGTMILAMGLYDRFVAAVAELTTLRWSRGLFVFLGLVAAGLVVALLGLSGPAVWLVSSYRWLMYSLFVGMTLGGVPVLVRLSRPFGPAVAIAVLVGLGGMVAFAFGLSATNVPLNVWTYLAAGAIATAAMVLPGISGSYVLLVLGLYDVVIGSLSFTELRADLGASVRVLVPVVLGAAVGIAALSNVLKLLLARFPRVSHGVLLGLLLGSVAGLWPFQRAVHPELATKRDQRGVQALLEGAGPGELADRYGIAFAPEEAEALRARYEGATPGELKRLGLELELFPPAVWQIGAALGAAALGFAITRGLGAREAGRA